MDGINGILTDEGILLNGTRFEDVSTFQNEDLTCLLFPLDDHVQVNMGKLAYWRVATHESFGGTWLSDYVENSLGGFAWDQPAQGSSKADCALIGTNGNIFNLMGIASRTLKEHGQSDQAQELIDRITQCHSYDDALSIIGDYVNITCADDPGEDLDEGMVMG